FPVFGFPVTARSRSSFTPARSFSGHETVAIDRPGSELSVVRTRPHATVVPLSCDGVRCDALTMFVIVNHSVPELSPRKRNVLAIVFVPNAYTHTRTSPGLGE